MIITPGTLKNPYAAKILFVDDYEMVRMMLRNTFASLGFKNVAEASDGAAAITLLKAGLAQNDPFHMIFCDWSMPNLSGLDVLKHCKDDPLLHDLPFVMITAESDEKKVMEALRTGVTDYIVKPVAPATLEKKIIRIVAKLTMGVA